MSRRIRIIIILTTIFIAAMLISYKLMPYAQKENDCIQLLIDNKEQQAELQEQIDAINIRIKETDRTITEHWKDMLRILNQVKEAPTTNE